MSFGDTLVAAMPFVMVILVVGMTLLFRFRVNRQRNDLMMRALEKGLPPSEITALLKPARSWVRGIAVGVFFIVCSIGFFASAWIDHRINHRLDERILMFGFVSLAVGIAALIAGLLQRRAEKQS